MARTLQLDDLKTTPTIREVDPLAPRRWLHFGWRDMHAGGVVSLLYAAIFIVGGYLLGALVWLRDIPYLILPLTTGFLLIGPLVGVGFYAISRRLELGWPVRFRHLLSAWIDQPGQLLGMGVTMLVIFLAWIDLSLLIFALMFNGITPADAAGYVAALLSIDNLPLLLGWILAGGLIAAFVFAISVVAVPLLFVARDIDLITAILTSLRAVRTNARVMVVWAGLIAALTAFGLATAFLGLLFTLPLIGHASWHAFRELVDTGD